MALCQVLSAGLSVDSSLVVRLRLVRPLVPLLGLEQRPEELRGENRVLGRDLPGSNGTNSDS